MAEHRPLPARADEADSGAAAALFSLGVMAGLAAVLALSQAAPSQTSPVVRPAISPSARTPAPETRRPPAPDRLQGRLDAIARRFRQPVGMAVMDVDQGWIAAVDGDGVYPQQSVSKLWVAISVLDAVDQGRVGLDDSVVLRDDDRSVFYQPLARLIGRGGYRITVRALLGHALSESDNAANDKLMQLVGGPRAVSRIMARKGLADLRVGAAERDLQAGIAGLNWSPAYGFGRAFQQVREQLPDWRRDDALAAYLAQPPDGVSPIAIARALSALERGRLLSAPSTATMLQMMAEARTGPLRLKGGLPSGWSIAHKTGTGPDWRGASVGINDVALLTAPDGRTYAAAVMIRRTSHAVPDRLAMFQQVSRAIVDSWAADRASGRGSPLRR